MYKKGLVVGNGGYYSKASGKKWVTPHKTNKQPLPLKNNPKRKKPNGQGTREVNGLFRTKA